MQNLLTETDLWVFPFLETFFSKFRNKKIAAGKIVRLRFVANKTGPNRTTSIYNASVAKIYNATNILARFYTKNYLSPIWKTLRPTTVLALWL
jgi:cytoplasmic iron level regulating protein YaaA (DUF328/UPF0246 family)